MNGSTTLSPELERFRRLVVGKMGEVAAKLAALKSGQDVTLATLKLPQEEEVISPLDRAQLYYDHLKRVLASFTDGSYGSCCTCGAPIQAVELEQVPWADTCGRCAGS